MYFSNKNFGLLYDEVLSWDRKNNETGEIISPVPKDIVEVLNSVKTTFEQHYGSDYINSLKAYILPCGDDPISYRHMNLIGLMARGRSWSQYAYQFAHELCHLTIPNEVAQPFRWLEESICELASIFFMLEMANLWTYNPPYPNWMDYAPALSKYVNDILENKPIQIPNTLSFSRFISDNLEFLSSHCYERNINCLCAKYLLPVFVETPSLWQDVPALSKLEAEVDFYTALSSWKEYSKAKDAIEKIITLFDPN